MIYNVTERDCIYIGNGTTSNETTTNATTNASKTITFIPLPYAMVAAAGVAVVLVLKMSLQVQAYSNLFAMFPLLLQMATATTAAVLLA